VRYGQVLLQFPIRVSPSCPSADFHATCRTETVFEISAFSQIHLKFINGFRSFWERGVDKDVNRKSAQQNLYFLREQPEEIQAFILICCWAYDPHKQQGKASKQPTAEWEQGK